MNGERDRGFLLASKIFDLIYCLGQGRTDTDTRRLAGRVTGRGEGGEGKRDGGMHIAERERKVKKRSEKVKRRMNLGKGLIHRMNCCENCRSLDVVIR